MKKEILVQFDIAWQVFEDHGHNRSEEEAIFNKDPFLSFVYGVFYRSFY